MSNIKQKPFNEVNWSIIPPTETTLSWENGIGLSIIVFKNKGKHNTEILFESPLPDSLGAAITDAIKYGL